MASPVLLACLGGCEVEMFRQARRIGLGCVSGGVDLCGSEIECISGNFVCVATATEAFPD